VVDLLGFARLHLADGVTVDGQRVLSAEAARAMREPQAAIPEPWTSGSHVGLESYDVAERDAAMVLVARPGGVLALSLGTDRIEAELVPFAPDAYLVQLPGRADWLPVMFYTLRDGTRYLHVGGQAAPRTGIPDSVSECPR
jgi:hypothetical protein